MPKVTVERSIQAPAQVVFDAVADIEHLPDVNEIVLRVEFLSEQREGVGTRFRETRAMNGNEMDTELEVTEWRPPEQVRMVADSHGTVWDTVFSVRPEGDATHLTIAMDARAHKLLPKLLNPIFQGLFKRGLSKHIDAVKSHCEAKAT